MTIKELEERTGMARANIRFYENEGLLSPKRLDNGYRDYSEEDARTLEKIKLLRQLQLDIDTIRKVQQGALTLDQVLFVQMTKLEGDRVLMERAAQVCRELERSGVEYAALDPEPWLARLEPEPRPVLPNPPPPTPKEEAERDNTPQACYHPWMRCFARALDMALYDTAINVFWLLAFRDQSLIRFQNANLFTTILTSMALLALTLALEPLWLHFVGWTPGKWVFGLKLRDKDGNKLPLDWAFDRSKTLAWEGYGWNLPIYSLYRFWKCRQDALEGWNGSWNSGRCLRYTKEERRFSAQIFVTARVALGATLFVSLLWSTLPPCRGPVDVAEFARNYNHFHAQMPEDSTKGPRMTADGRWEGAPDGYGQGGTVQTRIDGVWIELEEPVWDEPEFTLEDGRVTAVAIRVSGGCIDGVPARWRERLAILALSGSTGNWSLLKPDLEGWLLAADGALGQFGDGEAQVRGLRVAKQETMSGFQETEIYWMLTPIVGEEQSYERVVTISLTE